MVCELGVSLYMGCPMCGAPYNDYHKIGCPADTNVPKMMDRCPNCRAVVYADGIRVGDKHAWGCPFTSQVSGFDDNTIRIDEVARLEEHF